MSVRQRYLKELREFISFPSISADPARKNDVRKCALWLSAHLRKCGLKNVKLFETKLHPVVYADYIVDKRLPTILFYGHYDVQPAAPLDQWKFNPFNPVIKDNYIYGRGASDDKGQMFVHIKAIEQWIMKTGAPPANVKCIFEGEEEIGSPHLEAFIRANRDLLLCDAAVISDTAMLSEKQPAITYALRGLLNVEISLQGQETELHSGTFGGMVYNPLQALSEIISKLHFKNGRIAIPGFYESVQRISAAERAYMASNGPTNLKLRKDAGIKHGWGLDGYSDFEKVTAWPSLSVTSIKGGYQGEGAKNSIPPCAFARLNIRLVPGQHPDDIEQLLRDFLGTITPPAFEIRVTSSSKASPVVLSTRNYFLKAAAMSYNGAFGKSPVFLRSGGTIPVVNMFKDILKIPTVLMGFALQSDNKHGPNEKFYLPNFYSGIETSMLFMKNVFILKNRLTKKHSYL